MSETPNRSGGWLEPERWAILAPMIDGALDLPPGERGAYFDRVTAGNPALRLELESLVLECEQTSPLLDRSAAERFPLLLQESAAAPPDLLGDRFVIERELGRGGMATVYLARDRKHDRLVAVKVLRPEIATLLGPERFLREIRTAANLQHPHILPLHDSGEVEGALYYVMPYVEGESLRDRLQREPQLPLAEASRITREVADALAYAHARDIVHRDIKPENILLSGGHALLMDFGIARAISSSAGANKLTGTGLAIGTPAYMPPEQSSGDLPIDGRTDVYALGCVLYEMLTGHPPFSGTTQQEILRRHALDQVPPLRTARPELPVAVEQLVGRALAKAPADRFDTAAAFRAACEDLTAPAAAHRGTKRALLALAGLAVLVIGVALVQLAGRRGEATTSPALESARSVAVLPFRNLGGNPDNESFSDGLSEEIAMTLGRIEGVDMRAPRSAFGFKGKDFTPPEVGEKLGVEYLVDGSVQLSGDHVRVRAHLVRARQDSIIWSDEYDRPAGDVFAIQDEIARAIAGELRIHLADAGKDALTSQTRVDPEAHELYLKGRFFFEKRDSASLRSAQRYFEEAINKDSSYALAYAGLSDALSHHSVFGYSAPRASFPRALDYALKALALDSSLAEVHSSLGFIALFYEWDWAKAARELGTAQRLGPNYSSARLWRAWLLIASDSLDAAVAEGRRALQLDPLNRIVNIRLGSFLFFARRYPEAMEQFRRTAELDSTFFQLPWERARVLTWMGQCSEALSQLSNAADQQGGILRGARGVSYARCQDRAAAMREVESRRTEARGGKYVPRYALALTLAALGDAEAALSELERAFDEKEWMIFTIRAEPAFQTLRSNPRFLRLIERLRFPS